MTTLSGSAARKITAHQVCFICIDESHVTTHGHTRLRIGDPVRSRIHKQSRDQLVVGWVTTSES